MDESKKGKIKGPAIGLHQAKRLCQLSEQKRIAFIAEGLPIILNSARGFWEASQRLNEHPREAKVLEGFAEEEAAKILILMDIVRCPTKLVQSRISKMIDWFYDHLARLLYAEATTWKPIHLTQLREYVDRQRRGHYVEGEAGEYIMPNWAVYARESALYADVESYEDDQLAWNAPRTPYLGYSFGPLVPPALRIAEAMQQFGLFTHSGLRAMSDVWGSVEYLDKEDHHLGRHLIERLLERLKNECLILETARREHVATLYNEWQIPMYNLDFSLIPVSLEDLQAERDAEYWSFVGDPR